MRGDRRSRVRGRRAQRGSLSQLGQRLLRLHRRGAGLKLDTGEVLQRRSPRICLEGLEHYTREVSA